jgi:hypothetical protein
MGKRSNLYEIYFGPIGGIGSSIGNKLKNGPRGSMHSTGDPLVLDAEFEDESDLDDLDDEDDIDVLSKVRQSMSVNSVDIGRRNPGNTSYDNIGYAYGMVAEITGKASRNNDPVKKHSQNLARIRDAEKSKEATHTTMAVQGVSPNMTYRTSKGGKAKKTSYSSGTYPTSHRPRVDMTATRYGISRAPLPRHNELDDNPIFSLNDLLDKHEVSLAKHKSNVNRIRNTINELNDNFYDI